MKIVVAALLCLLTLPALAQDSVRVKMTKSHVSALGGKCVIDASYPVVPGRADLSRKIRELLPTVCKAEDVEPGTVYHVEQDFKVTYNSHGLLCVYGEGLSMTTKDGHAYQAHPNKLFGGVTLDIKSAKAYSLRDLFGSDAYAKLDPLLGAGATKVMESTEPVTITEHTYHCYLSQKGVTFYQIFDNFAAGSVQVTLPYKQAFTLMNPRGPLARLKR